MSCVGPVMELGVTMLPAPGCGRDHRAGRRCEASQGFRDRSASRLRRRAAHSWSLRECGRGLHGGRRHCSGCRHHPLVVRRCSCRSLSARIPSATARRQGRRQATANDSQSCCTYCARWPRVVSPAARALSVRSPNQIHASTASADSEAGSQCCKRMEVVTALAKAMRLRMTS